MCDSIQEFTELAGTEDGIRGRAESASNVDTSTSSIDV